MYLLAEIYIFEIFQDFSQKLVCSIDFLEAYKCDLYRLLKYFKYQMLPHQAFAKPV